MPVNFNPDHYFNRELSWLKFNERVLEEAADAKNPLAERLRFLLITESNLDEFFMVRMPNLFELNFNEWDEEWPDRRLSQDILPLVRASIHRYYEKAYALLKNELLPAIAEKGVEIVNIDQLNAEENNQVEKYFNDEVFPILTPLAIDPGHPFPRLANRSLNLVVSLHSNQRAPQGNLFAVVQIPPALPRLFKLNSKTTQRYIWIEELIASYLSRLFSGHSIRQSHVFRVTRDTDLNIEEEAADNLMMLIQRELRQREKGAAVRLEVRPGMPVEIRNFLLDALELDEDDIYVCDGFLPFAGFKPLLDIPPLNKEVFRSFTSIPAVEYESPAQLFSAIRKHDIYTHLPFDSYSIIEDLIDASADDPNVLGIKLTLYRTGIKSRIVDALIRGARNGKQVTALVELKARFDEETNINWAKRMEEEGVHVVYGLIGLKTHCKVALIVRKEQHKIVRYVHISTGNYNSTTAKLYTDFGFLTVDNALAEDVTHLFNTITGYSELPKMTKIFTSPHDLKKQVLQLIRHEAELAKQGKRGQIIAKMNSLVDRDVIDELYVASQSGVSIDLIIRGICCLRPGVQGLSENIRVRSIVGRFLEHSRFYVFMNAGAPKVFISSADWMPRNFMRRIELMAPIENSRIKKFILSEVLPAYLNDNISARILDANGEYHRIREKAETQINPTDTASTTKSSLNAQEYFIRTKRHILEKREETSRQLKIAVKKKTKINRS